MEKRMNREEMYERTTQFAVRVVRMVKSLPHGTAEDVIARQLTRSATSIGANYREACHGRSHADFLAKLKICEGEADETVYWLDLLAKADMMKEARMQALMDEAREFVAMFTAATRTLSKS
ncbi:MAG: four helix bundle protein [Akkermansia sp.]|nr:four helix bundle protein [Akkermansia sp.]